MLLHEVLPRGGPTKECSILLQHKLVGRGGRIAAASHWYCAVHLALLDITDMSHELMLFWECE